MGRQLENWIASYLRMVRDTEPCERFHLWTAISILGAALGRKCEVALGPEIINPNLYVFLTGPPATRKSTAIKYGVDLVREVPSIKTAPDAVTKERFYQKLEEATSTEYFGDRVLVHSSLLVVASELVVFMGDRDSKRIADLCDLYDGRSTFDYQTKASGSNYIINPSVWILGATTPHWITVCMPMLAVGGGMTSRSIFAVSLTKGKHIPATEMPPFNPELRSALINDLNEIHQMKGMFTLTSGASQMYSQWYTEQHPKIDLHDGRFASFLERLPMMIIKTSMILSASASSDKIIHQSHIVKSVRAFNDLIKVMPQAFGGMGLSTIAPQTDMIRQFIAKRGRVTKSEILKYHWMDVSVWDLDRILHSLVAEKFILISPHGDDTLLTVRTGKEKTDGAGDKPEEANGYVGEELHGEDRE